MLCKLLKISSPQIKVNFTKHLCTQTYIFSYITRTTLYIYLCKSFESQNRIYLFYSAQGRIRKILASWIRIRIGKNIRIHGSGPKGQNMNQKLQKKFTTVVSDNINILKTTFECNFDFIKLLNNMDTQKYGNKKKLSI